MSRIAETFARLRAGGRRALVPFITAGDPSLESTVEVMHALVEAGADVIELGVPFSDPMADGPVIQRSSERALARGMDTARVFEFVSEFRLRDSKTPVVLMGYLNPVEMRGHDAYAASAASAGIDGILLVDLPPEESHGIRDALNRHGLDLISLAAPTTSAGRLGALASAAQGYLYYVSLAGVTGSNFADPASITLKVSEVRSLSPVPVLIGFGIKDAGTAASMGALADGIIVGSALVENMATAGSPAEAARLAAAFLGPLRNALDALS